MHKNGAAFLCYYAITPGGCQAVVLYEAASSASGGGFWGALRAPTRFRGFAPKNPVLKLIHISDRSGRASALKKGSQGASPAPPERPERSDRALTPAECNDCEKKPLKRLIFFLQSAIME